MNHLFTFEMMKVITLIVPQMIDKFELTQKLQIFPLLLREDSDVLLSRTNKLSDNKKNKKKLRNFLFISQYASLN